MFTMKVPLLLACMLVMVLAQNSTLSLEQRIARLEGISRDLNRQVMLQSFYNEELVRSQGSSGIIDIPLRQTGSKNFYSNAQATDAFMGMHDHPELERTVGLDEMNVVMNGYYFRTRHNDYELVMPSSKSGDYHATEKIPFPPVPDSVLKERTVNKQIKEMRQYFKAFKQQHTRSRDYRKYFLPNLCYMEGAWTNITNADGIEEPFDNSRHHFDALSWSNLLEKARYNAFTGSHSKTGSIGLLPLTVYRVEDGTPFFAQWEYRILCHPLKENLPVKRFQPVDDLNSRLPRHLTPEEALLHPSQRFVLNSVDYDHSSQGDSLLDSLMNQIPGKNNYKGQIEDHTLGGTVLTFSNPPTPMNTGFYHRYYKTSGKGAMGSKQAFRGYNDANNWVAQTTHDKIIKLKAGKCSKKHLADKTCSTHASYTFAIPLEIIYTTPLARWNPYGVPEQEERQKLPVLDLHVGEGTDEEIETYYKNRVLEPNRTPVDDVTEGGKRTGTNTTTTAFKGASALHFYKTPKEFYRQTNNKEWEVVNVLDSKGQMRELVSSGIRTVTHDIVGAGRVRLRYPLAPLHGDGQGLSKELNALKELTLKSRSYIDLYDEEPCHTGNTTKRRVMLEYELRMTYQDPPGQHSHTFEIPEDVFIKIQKFGHTATVTTSLAQGHTHKLELAHNERKGLFYKKCDSLRTCWDGHRPKLLRLSKNKHK